jgi:hypothetical protein
MATVMTGLTRRIEAINKMDDATLQAGKILQDSPEKRANLRDKLGVIRGNQSRQELVKSEPCFGKMMTIAKPR